MAITDLQISEELMTDAPSIKYRGDEGPKSPQEEQQMMVDALLKEEYNNYVYDLLEQRPDATPMSFEEFKRMVIAEGQMSGGQPLPQDPTEPVNPFKPKPIGPVLPDKRQMAAFGGIMGVDGRRQYGIGSFFQKYIKDPIEMAITGKTYEDLERESQARVDAEPEGYESVFDRLFKGEKGTDKQGKETREGGLEKYIIPAIGGITAGLFTKKNQDGSQGGQPTADETALMLADLKKSANILDQKQGLAAGLNFLPDVAARKFTPDEMIEAYKTTAANGGRIGFSEGTDSMTFGLLSDNADISKEINQKVIEYENEYMRRTGNVPPEFYGEKYRMKLMEDYMDQNKAEGGRIGFESGLRALKSKDIPPAKMPDVFEQMLQNMSEEERIKFLMMMRNNAERMPKIEPNPDAIPPVRMPTFPKNNNRGPDDLDIPTRLNLLNPLKAMPRTMAMGGRIRFENAGPVVDEQTTAMILDMNSRGMDVDTISTMTQTDANTVNAILSAQNQKAEGGLMDLGGMEKDYRAEGGFVPIGKEEKADDVPARLSVNEFVFTADAVRNAGGGDIDEGARVMENMMKHLEAGGQVSEESQGMAGARDMFATSQRLSEVV